RLAAEIARLAFEVDLRRTAERCGEGSTHALAVVEGRAEVTFDVLRIDGGDVNRRCRSDACLRISAERLATIGRQERLTYVNPFGRRIGSRRDGPALLPDLQEETA